MAAFLAASRLALGAAGAGVAAAGCVVPLKAAFLAASRLALGGGGDVGLPPLYAYCTLLGS
jgi:hypothetical protein